MLRRRFIQAAACFAVPSMLPTTATRAAGIADRYSKRTTGFYLGKLKTLTEVDDPEGFTEGPCCDRAGTVFFTNTHASAIMKWDGKQLSTFRQDKNAANGLLFDRTGRLVACEG